MIPLRFPPPDLPLPEPRLWVGVSLKEAALSLDFFPQALGVRSAGRGGKPFSKPLLVINKKTGQHVENIPSRLIIFITPPDSTQSGLRRGEDSGEGNLKGLSPFWFPSPVILVIILKFPVPAGSGADVVIMAVGLRFDQVQGKAVAVDEPG